MLQIFQRIRWFNLAVLTITPLIGLYGVSTTPLTTQTLIWSLVCYVLSMIGEFIRAIEFLQVAYYLVRHNRRFVQMYHVADRDIDRASPQDITVFGPTGHIKPLFPSKYFLSLRPQVRFKAHATGGREVIDHTIATRTPNWTLTMPKEVSSIATLGGCWSSQKSSRGKRTSVTCKEARSSSGSTAGISFSLRYLATFCLCLLLASYGVIGAVDFSMRALSE